jgi:uncharacterized protein YbjQ (UPF0145 family)
LKYNIKITTTSNFEGYKIIKYFDLISDHVVVGSNIFSDNMAAWTDVFGGFSNTYQRKLSLIKNKAIQNLRQSAKYIGANAIVGIKIDVDQISSKNTSMFMVTVIGTPVIIEANSNNTKEVLNDNENEYTGDEINIILQKNKLIKELETQPLIPITDEKWEFIIENKFFEICQQLMLCAVKWHKSLESGLNKKVWDFVKIYLSNLNKEYITQLLYDLYLDENINWFHELIYDIIKEKEIYDLNRLIELTKNKNEDLKYNLFNLITVRKESSKYSDIEVYEKLLNQIKDNYKEIITYSKQKKLFSSTEEDIWICTCSNKNSIDLSYCSKCDHDKYGFKKYKINPPQAIEWLEDTVKALLILERNSKL